MSIATWTGNTLNGFLAFLNANKEGTIFEDCTINLASNTLTITKNNCTFTVFSSGNFAAECYVSFANGVATLRKGGAYNNLYPSGAIISNSGLIVSVTSYQDSAITSTGLVMLTLDSNNELACIMRNITDLKTGTTATNLQCLVGDSTSITTLSITPIYSTQKTALIPVVINTPTGQTTIPNFYTSIQTQLPAIGLQAGRMDSTDYITNGYCFVRD